MHCIVSIGSGLSLSVHPKHWDWNTLDLTGSFNFLVRLQSAQLNDSFSTRCVCKSSCSEKPEFSSSDGVSLNKTHWTRWLTEMTHWFKHRLNIRGANLHHDPNDSLIQTFTHLDRSWSLLSDSNTHPLFSQNLCKCSEFSSTLQGQSVKLPHQEGGAVDASVLAWNKFNPKQDSALHHLMHFTFRYCFEQLVDFPPWSIYIMSKK